MPEEKTAKLFHVSGEVQGVGYRYFAQRAAEQLGVSGYVKNLGDGRVEAYALGTGEQLRALAAELQRGPRGARVTHLSESDAEPMHDTFQGFSIDY